MAQAQQAGEPTRQYPKKPGKNRFAHTANTQYGMGDYTGIGIKQKVGKLNRSYLDHGEMTSHQLKTPPKSLA